MEIAGRVALVTGASSGIGAAVAASLADRGARLLVHGRDPVRTSHAARRTRGTALVGDLATPTGVDTLAAQAVAVHGRVDILVANAGQGWSGAFTQMPTEDLDRVLAVDLLAPLRLTRILLPHMVTRRSGHLALVGSVAGEVGVAGEAAYAAAKAGLSGFAESVRLELEGSHVQVSLTVPGAVQTGFFTSRGRPYDRRVPRAVSPESVAEAVVSGIEHELDEVWVPRWLRIAGTMRAVAPRTYRRLATRYGEPVRSIEIEQPRPRPRPCPR